MTELPGVKLYFKLNYWLINTRKQNVVGLKSQPQIFEQRYV